MLNKCLHYPHCPKGQHEIFFLNQYHKNTHKQQQTSSLFTVESGGWLEKHDPSCGGQLDVHDITWLTVRDIWLNGCFRYSVMCNITAYTHTHEQKAPCGCLEMWKLTIISQTEDYFFFSLHIFQSSNIYFRLNRIQKNDFITTNFLLAILDNHGGYWFVMRETDNLPTGKLLIFKKFLLSFLSCGSDLSTAEP